MKYNIPYRTYNFEFENIDENLYKYFKTNSIDKILADHKEFKKNQLSQFKEDNITEYHIYFTSSFIFIVSLIITFGAIAEFINVDNNIAALFGLMILFSYFGLFYSYSFTMSRREIRLALKKRKKILKTAHKYAKTTSSFSEFIKKITV